MLEFFLNQAACALKVSLEAVVKTVSFVAKKTLSGTPQLNIQLYLFQCKHHFAFDLFDCTSFFVAHAVNTRHAANIKSVFL